MIREASRGDTEAHIRELLASFDKTKIEEEPVVVNPELEEVDLLEEEAKPRPSRGQQIMRLLYFYERICELGGKEFLGEARIKKVQEAWECFLQTVSQGVTERYLYQIVDYVQKGHLSLEVNPAAKEAIRIKARENIEDLLDGEAKGRYQAELTRFDLQIKGLGKLYAGKKNQERLMARDREGIEARKKRWLEGAKVSDKRVAVERAGKYEAAGMLDMEKDADLFERLTAKPE